MNFTLNINSDNDALVNNTELEVSEILHAVASKVSDGYDHAPIRDANGNLIGSWRLTMTVG